MFKDILVCVNESVGKDSTISAAAKFANEHNCSLTGLYIMVNEIAAFPPLGMTGIEAALTLLENQEEKAMIAEKSFNRITSKIGCSARWHKVEDFEQPIKLMTYVDLIFINQVVKDESVGFSNGDFINHLILETAKPIIIIPSDWNQTRIGKRILLGWNESCEATRAMQDALPLMQNADKVDIVTVSRKYNKDAELIKGIEISTYLSHRGINCEFHAGYTDKKHNAEEDVLLYLADDYGSDLIVIGGYGHSRFREIILGGVTRSLVKNSDAPLFLSH